MSMTLVTAKLEVLNQVQAILAKPIALPCKLVQLLQLTQQNQNKPHVMPIFSAGLAINHKVILRITPKALRNKLYNQLVTLINNQ